MKAVVIRWGSTQLNELTLSGNYLDISVCCKTLGERLREALEQVATEVITTSIERLPPLLERMGDEDVIIVDSLAAFPNPAQAFKEVVDAYNMSPSEVVVQVTKPYAVRGVPVDARGSTLNEVGEGSEVFTGIIAGRASRLRSLLRGVKNLHELLEKLQGSQVTYWVDVWLRLENPFDLVLYTMLLLQRLEETVIDPRARVSPTAVLEGPMVVEESVTIDHYAVVKGPVCLCRRSFVGIHAVVRPFTCLEEEARVGSLSETYISLLLKRATLSSHVYVTGSVVGEEAKIEAFSLTKVVYGREAAEKLGVIAPFTPEVRAGAVVRAGRRVLGGSTLKPLSVV